MREDIQEQSPTHPENKQKKHKGGWIDRSGLAINSVEEEAKQATRDVLETPAHMLYCGIFQRGFVAFSEMREMTKKNKKLWWGNTKI